VSEEVYGPIIGGLVTILFGWNLISGLKRGMLEWPTGGFSPVSRTEDPLKFWVVTACLALFTAIFFVGTVLAILFPRGI
jgi:hypothetical protein